MVLLFKFLQTQLQVKNMNISYYDICYTVIKVRNENKDIDNQYEFDDNNFIDINDFKTPNHYIGRKSNN